MSGDGGLRSAILDLLARARGVAFGPHVDIADAILALPEVAALRAKAAAADRVRELAEELHERGRIEVASMEAENDREWAARYEARAATYARAEHLVRRALDGEGS